MYAWRVSHICCFGFVVVEQRNECWLPLACSTASLRFNIPLFMVYGKSRQYVVGRSKRVLRVHFDGENS
jgi:hypothetical protein